jgi:hypothetical protein
MGRLRRQQVEEIGVEIREGDSALNLGHGFLKRSGSRLRAPAECGREQPLDGGPEFAYAEPQGPVTAAPRRMAEPVTTL